MNQIGERILLLRIDNDIIQKELASHLHVTPGTISNYENGIHVPDANTLCSIAEYFNVSVDYILGRTDFLSPISTLNNYYYKNMTVSDYLNFSLEINKKNRSQIIEYLRFLSYTEQHKFNF